MLSYGQTDIDSLFSGMVGYASQVIREDSTGIFYIQDHDTSKINFYSHKSKAIRIYDKEHHLLVEGKITDRVCSQLVLKGSKWVSYYPNGRTKTIGFYYRNQPVGLWKVYYSNGQLMKSYTYKIYKFRKNIEICKAGLYEEYYETGQQKTIGTYKPAFHAKSILLTVDSLENYSLPYYPMTNQRPIPVGTWKFFKSNGEHETSESYKE